MPQRTNHTDSQKPARMHCALIPESGTRAPPAASAFILCHQTIPLHTWGIMHRLVVAVQICVTYTLIQLGPVISSYISCLQINWQEVTVYM